MKKYSFIFLLDSQASAAIENIREKFSGEKLVDDLPPHLTFKRRFVLGKEQTIEGILDILDKFPLERIEVQYRDLEQFGDFAVMKVENSTLNKWHRDLLTTLGNNIVTDGTEWEGDSYNPHITLVAGLVANMRPLNLTRIFLDKVCLYEYEFSSDRRISLRLLKCRVL